MLDFMSGREEPELDVASAASDPHQPPPAKRAKTEMVDNIEGYVQITVTDSSMNEHTVNCLPAPYQRSKLVVELTEANILLLTKAPSSEENAEFVPEISYAD
eukprot:1556063-Pyramimonas_sp.AAC.1